MRSNRAQFTVQDKEDDDDEDEDGDESTELDDYEDQEDDDYNENYFETGSQDDMEDLGGDDGGGVGGMQCLVSHRTSDMLTAVLIFTIRLRLIPLEFAHFFLDGPRLTKTTRRAGDGCRGKYTLGRHQKSSVLFCNLRIV
jgi:hypothetical protein